MPDLFGGALPADAGVGAKPQPPRDRPVIFSAAMVQALLAGRKTQTRRLASSPLSRCQVGDRLWVREGFVLHMGVQQVLGYDANGYRATERWERNMPAILMPRSASRLTLAVTGVRFEFLEDISEADAEAEGFKEGQLHEGWGPRDIGGGVTIESLGTMATAKGHFLAAWAGLHPKWDGYSNPAVVALAFTVRHGNIDYG